MAFPISKVVDCSHLGRGMTWIDWIKLDGAVQFQKRGLMGENEWMEPGGASLHGVGAGVEEAKTVV